MQLYLMFFQPARKLVQQTKVPSGAAASALDR